MEQLPALFPKVIAAMVEVSTRVAARITIDQKPAEMHAFGPVHETGRVANALTGATCIVQILGGSCDASPLKEKISLRGLMPRWLPVITPVIEIELRDGDIIDHYIMARLERHEDRRSLDIGEKHLLTGHFGTRRSIRSQSIIKVSTTPLGANKFRLAPRHPLKDGEYVIYVADPSAGKIDETTGRGYDFSVSQQETHDSSHQPCAPGL